MIAEDLLDDVRAALTAVLSDVDPTEIVVVGGGQARRRSDLVYLGLRDGVPAPRWVVKVPRPESRQHDLPPPLDASAQVEALRRMDAHLSGVAGRARVPGVVALLPDQGGYVMDYADGSSLAALLGARALVDDEAVLRGCEEAARLLRALHDLEPVSMPRPPLDEMHRASATRVESVLRSAGLPVRSAWLGAGADSPAPAGTVVLLHGDFAPENILLGSRATWCLDPDLVERSWAEQDVVRFVVMLCDAPLFVLLADLPAARRLRRRAVAVFLETYYSDLTCDPAFAPLLRAALASRWATRDGDVVARGPRLGWLRRWLLRRHFTRLLDEASFPSPSRPPH